MRIVALSDTHGFHRGVKVPEGDLLIFAGDLTNRGEKEIVDDFAFWIDQQPHQYKIVVAGNHDTTLQTHPRHVRPVIEDVAIYLEDETTTVEGFSIYGSPWTPKFMNNSPWAFETLKSERKELWERIPDYTDILVTHGPPNRILDKCGDGYVGDEELGVRVKEIASIKHHIFGHIHESYGQREIGGVKYYNVSQCDALYRIHNPPVVIDL